MRGTLFFQIKTYENKVEKSIESNIKMKINLESLLKIATESPKEEFSGSKYEYFVDELKKNNLKMKISL